ncbi:MAG TPA: hypothetical protein PKY35_07215 [Candidatus Hydrogenedentes bacterium]|nr:hypothetical protein [Candidatus Hydrogenedentota bacterium]HOL76805.1 hypothetical protein [Candidatus Hydrogenedentota bacterium]HPO85718.1 hypothetical protein [Candidatus Hydrogenedentota bacterium]
MIITLWLPLTAIALTGLGTMHTDVDTAPRKLNNFTTEVLNVSPVDPSKEYSFQNPRTGWVYISAYPKAEFLIDGAACPAYPWDKAHCETMQWLKAGVHTLQVHNIAGNDVVKVVVRTVPETHFVRYPQEPRFPQLGEFSWEWLTTNALSSVNTVVGFPEKNIDPQINEWTSLGRKFIAYGSLPHHNDLTGDAAFQYWYNSPGFQDTRLSGLIADEFSGRQHPLYPAWIEGMRLLGQQVAGTGKAFYAYCGGPGMHSRPEARELVRTVFDSGFYMAWERYHHEMPTEEEARGLMESLLGKEISLWQARFPNCQRQMVLVLGIFATGPDLDVQPDVNYKVWMDMQMQYLATHPAFDGLFGIHWWYSGAANEELLRWQSALYRHYCLEGATDLLSERYGWTYMLPHVQNPDFLDGSSGWTLQPAEESSIVPRYLERYARAQNRYWHRGGEPDYPSGNAYLWMKRSAHKPNKALQTIQNLVPGKVYTAQMITADYQDIIQGRSDQKKHGVSLIIKNAEILPSGSYAAVPVSSPWSHEQLPFKNGPAWFNHHQVMFRALHPTAELILSDWVSDLESGGPEGQELMFNYIQVQPYFEE